VTNIADNLKGALHAKSLRIEAPIPGEEAVGIEVPNRSPAGISFREIIESNEWKNFKGELPLLFGRDAAGRELIADLASMPHMLVAGATGQGKSVCLNSIINGLLMTKTPDQLKLIMVDPKSVEFTAYSSIPHLIVPIITDNKKVVFSLRWAVTEMEKRLKMFARARVKNIYDFNRRPSFTQTDMFGNDSEVGSDMPRTVPYIVIIIDEVADLMMAASKEVTPDISRLTAKARAAGIHLILATQRPDAKIITGTIKANIPGRVAFKTATSIDSRTILDDTGAENLIGRGDMLFKTKEALLIRAQGAWISETEIANITSFIEQHSNTDFDERFTNKLSTIKEAEVDIFASDDETAEEQGGGRQPAGGAGVKSEEGDDLLKRAVEVIINTNRASISHFQRRLGIGYNNAAKLCDRLEEEGIIGPQHGAGPRPIIMDQQQLLAVFNGNGGAGENAEAGGDAAVEAEAADDTGDLFTQEDNT
jgi:S-DNA-T family DNA segregation ATPase FtsK/SpoIIIE